MADLHASPAQPGAAHRGSTRRAIFIDRDGPLSEAGPGGRGALQRLAAAGWLLVVVSHHGPAQKPGGQGGPGEGSLQMVETRHGEQAAWAGVQLAGWFCRPHGAGPVACGCDGPAGPDGGIEPLEAAAAALRIDLSASWMIGGVLDDIEAGRRAGCRTVFVDRGHETQWRLSPWRIPDHSCGDLEQAAAVILGD